MGSIRLRETRVLLLRHAETAAPDRFHGAESDVGLGERGRRQAEAVAGPLSRRGPVALYSSRMRRAIETAEPIGRACALPLKTVADLHERRIGPLSGRRKDEGWESYSAVKRQWMAGQIDFTSEGAESYREIQDRVVPAFLDLSGDHPGETIVVVAHGVVIRVLLTSLLDGFGPADFERASIEFVAVHDLRFDGLHWRAERLGERLATETGTEATEGAIVD